MGETLSQAIKETSIDLIPQDWQVCWLNDVLVDQIKNGAFIKREHFGDGVPFLNVADVYKNISADLNRVERVCCTASEVEAYNLQEGDLIFVRSSLKRDGIGHCCIVGNVPEPSIFDCHFHHRTLFSTKW
jgi:type I restriction enzyme S subunit